MAIIILKEAPMAGPVTGAPAADPVIFSLAGLLPGGIQSGMRCESKAHGQPFVPDGTISDVVYSKDPQTGLESMQFHASAPILPLFGVKIETKVDTDGKKTGLPGQVYVHVAVTKGSTSVVDLDAKPSASVSGGIVFRSIVPKGAQVSTMALNGESFQLDSKEIPIPFVNSISGTIRCTK
jgi:hypothetical protein